MTPAIIVLVFIVLVIGYLAWRFGRSREVLTRWAAEHHFEILDAEYRWMFKGPYFFRSSDGQAVYYVTIRDQGGRTRRGYVRCGSWFLGLISDTASVRWEE